MIQNYDIEEEVLYEYAKKKNFKLSGIALRCTSCDELRRGITLVSTGEFLCVKCIKNRNREEFENDPEYIKLERVYRMRAAISKYKAIDAVKRYIK